MATRCKLERCGRITLCAVVLPLLCASAAPAGSYVFQLDSVIADSAYSPATSSHGTVTLTDEGNYVHVVVDLTQGSKVQALLLNYNDGMFDSLDDFGTLSDDETQNPDQIGVVEDEDNLLAGSYGTFDLRLPDVPPGNLGTDPFEDSLLLTGQDLDTKDFLFRENNGDGLWLAVHVGELAGGSSLWVGASALATPVPLPAAGVLLASGLVGLAGWRRRRAGGHGA